MRIAVLSDIHSNLAALQEALSAIRREAPDYVVVAGDAINRGPQPRECLEVLFERLESPSWFAIKGNHEEFVLLEREERGDVADWEREVYRHTRWTMTRIADWLDHVAAWPDCISLQGPDGSEVRFVHASMQGNRRGLYEDMEEPLMLEMIRPVPDVLVAGHTHVPFVRRLDGALVVNAGAVGLPFDGDTHLAYAMLEWRDGEWSARVERRDYDRMRTERAMRETGYLEEGGPMTALILDELRTARPRIGLWHRRFEQRVARGELTVGESVALLLREVEAVAPA